MGSFSWDGSCDTHPRRRRDSSASCARQCHSRSRNDMNADDFADAPGSDGTRFSRGFHRPNIATHEDRDVAIEEVFFANQNDVGRFNHRVGGFDSPDKTAGFYQSQRLVHVSSLLVRRVKYQKACTKAIDRIKVCFVVSAQAQTPQTAKPGSKKGDRHTQDPQLRFPGNSTNSCNFLPVKKFPPPSHLPRGLRRRNFFASCITSKAAMLTIYVRSYALHFTGRQSNSTTAW